MIDWTVLDSVGRRVRVNHALEHATITILSSRVGGVVLRGRSNRNGFYVMGDVTKEKIAVAADEALERLKAGQSELAIHPFCGTNLAVAGTLAGLSASVAGRLGRRSGTYPSAVLGALLALIVAQPIGFWVQKHVTTQSEVRDLRVVDIQRKTLLGKTLHFVRTSQ